MKEFLIPFEEKYQQILGCIAVAGLVPATVFAYYIHIVGTDFLNSFPKCIFLTRFHLYCPGCGGTHAVLALMRGDIIESFFDHPLVLYVFIIWMLMALSQILIFLGVRKRLFRVRSIYFVLAIIIMILTCVLKNFGILNTSSRYFHYAMVKSFFSYH